MATLFLARLDAGDRALFTRWAIVACRSPARRRAWTSLTHLGGVWCSIGAAIIPLAAHGALAVAARQAVATLACSHIVVQLIKRTVGRRRPSNGVGCTALIHEPDQFSFPSGHSAAAMSVAIVYAFAFPATAAVLIPLAVVVGVSRVCLGVHYPGDVFIGQLIAVLTALPIVLR